MRALSFHAVAGNPAVAPALMRQAETTLRPFDRYLNQAVKAARQRQFRYQLPWERVGDWRQKISLSALDHRVLLPRPEPAWLITNWPPDLPPDPRMPVMLVNRTAEVRVGAWNHTADGLRIRVIGELQSEDRMFWCGHECIFAREPEPAAPVRIVDAHGTKLCITAAPQRDEHGWIVALSGWTGSGPLDVDGAQVAPKQLPASEGLRWLRDEAGRTFELPAGHAESGAEGPLVLTVEDPPAAGPLTGDNGIRFVWKQTRDTRRSGAWVQLLPPEEEDAEDYIDPRAAFCEGDVQEVWTQARHHATTVFKVKRVDSDRYQLLLDRFPPEGTSLFLPVNTRSLQLQRRALRQLGEAPLPHHQGLLRLCEDPQRVRWPQVAVGREPSWTELTDLDRRGTDQQRAFVVKALATPDLAVLEGPPGSGKTTAICELIRQLVARGERVLLCASTHVAIDNVLERLLETDAPVDAVRIGRAERVDEKVQNTALEHRVEQLVEAWRTVPHLQGLGDGELERMATRTVIEAANLTCGTTMGIVRHPLFDDREQAGKPWEQPITALPHWDVLIVDEASKTLIQEFLVPALMARRWVVVGDVRQLPPFAERADILANLRGLGESPNGGAFPAEHQRACLLRSRLARPALRGTGMRWLVVEPPGVLDWLAREMEVSDDSVSATWVVAARSRRGGPFHEVSLSELTNRDPASLWLEADDWILVPDELLPKVADFLPADVLHLRDLTRGQYRLSETHPLFFRHAWWLARHEKLRTQYWERGTKVAAATQAERVERAWVAGRDLAAEIAWRITRVHELRHGRDQREREKLTRNLEQLMPRAADISRTVAEIHDIGLPSILEVLQEGIGDERADRPSALTQGMPRHQRHAFEARFGSLSYQHRMHPEISAFPREIVYAGQSLLDANTVALRDEQLGWGFERFGARRVWLDVRGREQGGVNKDEVAVVGDIVAAFLAWARTAGPPGRRLPRRWELACLCFYSKQERALSEMLREVTGDDRKSRFVTGDVEVVCGTVDRFQGREADLVLLSMRNTGRVGFLDSRNRLNVAITRARQQLVVVGNAQFFSRCSVSELEELVRRSPIETASDRRRGAR